MRTGRRPRGNDPRGIHAFPGQIADRGIVCLADIPDLTGILMLRRQSVAQRNKTISLLADTLTDKIEEPGITGIPASAVNPYKDLVTDPLIRLIVQEILFPVCPIGDLYRLKLFPDLKHLPVQAEVTQAFPQRIIHREFSFKPL